MTDEIQWPVILTSSQRTTDSGSNFFGQLEDLRLETTNKRRIPLLFANKEIDEPTRISLATAAAGVVGGTRYKMAAGYLVTAAINSTPHILEGGKFRNASVVIIWKNGSNIDQRIPVSDLMNVAHVLARMLDNSVAEFGIDNKRKSIEIEKVVAKPVVVAADLFTKPKGK